MSKNNSLKNITRHGQTNAWQVRVTRNGVKRTKLFSDGDYHASSAMLSDYSPGLALIKAIAYRNELVNASFKTFCRKY